jgi:hypothetical protein
VQRQAIVNGSNVDPNYSGVVALYLNNNTSFQCSGSLLRNFAVLTAKHCIDGLSEYQVTVRMGSQRSRVSKMFVNPAPYADTAVLILRDPLQMAHNGANRPYGFEELIHPAANNAALSGATGWCYGYGWGPNPNQNAPENGYETLRGALLPIQPRMGADRLISFFRGWNNAIQSFGDSGGPCYVFDSAGQRYVASALSDCFGGFYPDECLADAPHYFRDWANGILTTSHSQFTEAFTWSDNMQFYDTTTAGGAIDGPANWAIVGGQMRQSSNIYAGSTAATSLNKPGTMALNGYLYFNNGYVSVKAYSADDDAAGLVFRYVDINNYYIVQWDQQGQYLRMVKKQDGVNTLMGEVRPFIFKHSDWNTVRVLASGNAFLVWFNGQLKLYLIDSGEPFKWGRVGMYTWSLPATFDDLVIDPL